MNNMASTLLSLIFLLKCVSAQDDFFTTAPFCRTAHNRDDEYKWDSYCKAHTDTWKILRNKQKYETGEDFSWQYRKTSGECGPQCRPSCVTLMLDLDKLQYDTDLTCNANELCHCQHTPRPGSTCSERDFEALFDQHPKCYLEDADCLGPTLYDNKMRRAKNMLSSSDSSSLELNECDALPDDDFYCRFQDWKIINPIDKYSCRDGDYPECLDETKIYWEFCNIVEEDPQCDYDEECEGNRCGKTCRKRTEPFPPGWTTFVVSGAIPYRPDFNPLCDGQLSLADSTSSACFLQRVEVYYPPDDDCSTIGCPHCHDCPKLQLGDKFGPLELVGFGHQIQGNKEGHSCTACDSRNSVYCEKGVELDCDDLFKWNCHESRNCYTNQELGVASFNENQCSFAEDPNAQDETFAMANKAENTVEGNDVGFITSIAVPAAVCMLLLVGLLCCCKRKCNAGGSSKGMRTNSGDDASQSSSMKDVMSVANAAKSVEMDENVETIHISNLGVLKQKLQMLDCSRPTRTGE